MAERKKMKTDGLFTDDRVETLKKSEKSRLGSILGMDSTSGDNLSRTTEKPVREALSASDGHSGKKDPGTLESKKSKQAFIVNDPDALTTLKNYCYVHKIRLQDVFETLINAFNENPDAFPVESKK